MANHVANHQKKRRVLTRRESDLLRALRRGESEEKVKSAAEEVRAARVRVLNVRRSLVPLCDGPHAGLLRAFDEVIRECLSTPLDAIVQEFRRTLEMNKSRRSESDQV
jgi:hypothetical protein